MPKRKLMCYFAQNGVLTATGHTSAYCETHDQARAFLAKNNGGTIKHRTSRRGIFRVIEIVGVLPDGRVSYAPPSEQYLASYEEDDDDDCYYGD
jgi:hypothetical protein